MGDLMCQSIPIECNIGRILKVGKQHKHKDLATYREVFYCAATTYSPAPSPAKYPWPLNA